MRPKEARQPAWGYICVCAFLSKKQKLLVIAFSDVSRQGELIPLPHTFIHLRRALGISTRTCQGRRGGGGEVSNYFFWRLRKIPRVFSRVFLLPLFRNIQKCNKKNGQKVEEEKNRGGGGVDPHFFLLALMGFFFSCCKALKNKKKRDITKGGRTAMSRQPAERS
jgi:hypothetical protein